LHPVAAPELTAQQRRAASVKAVSARRGRAEVCRAVKEGRLDVREVLGRAESDEAIGAMRVSALVMAMPRYGPRRSAEALAALRIAPTRRLRGLGVAQRAAVASLTQPRSK
jgi:S13-like H2TH domain